MKGTSWLVGNAQLSLRPPESCWHHSPCIYTAACHRRYSTEKHRSSPIWYLKLNCILCSPVWQTTWGEIERSLSMFVLFCVGIEHFVNWYSLIHQIVLRHTFLRYQNKTTTLFRNISAIKWATNSIFLAQILQPSYSMSNVIMADEKLTLFHQYLRYRHTWGAIVFSILGAILWV